MSFKQFTLYIELTHEITQSNRILVVHRKTSEKIQSEQKRLLRNHLSSDLEIVILFWSVNMNFEYKNQITVKDLKGC